MKNHQTDIKHSEEKPVNLREQLIGMRDEAISDLAQKTEINMEDKEAAINALRSLRKKTFSIDQTLQEFTSYFKNPKSEKEEK